MIMRDDSSFDVHTSRTSFDFPFKMFDRQEYASYLLTKRSQITDICHFHSRFRARLIEITFDTIDGNNFV